MKVVTLFVLSILAAAAVSARGIPKKELQISPYIRFVGFSDIIQSLNLIDFHLTDEERESLVKFFQEISGFTPEEVSGVEKSKTIENAIVNSIASVKLTDEQNFEAPDSNFNAFMLALNYDLIAQILDPGYKKNILTIPIDRGHEHTEAQKGVLDVISKRWATSLTGRGVSVPEGTLAKFYEGTEEAVEKRKDSVHGIYSSLDRFVGDTLDQTNNKYGPYSVIPSQPVALSAVKNDKQ